MDEKFLVTEGASTGPGTVIESGAKTATLNGKPLLTVGSIATHPKGGDVVIEGMPTVLLNGQPITFAGAKTAQGGTLIANTTARILLFLALCLLTACKGGAATGGEGKQTTATDPQGINPCHRFEFNDCSMTYNGKPFMLGQSIEEFVQVFGPYDRRAGTKSNLYYWDNIGIQVVVNRDTKKVSYFYVYFNKDMSGEEIGITDLTLLQVRKEMIEFCPKYFFKGNILVDGVPLGRGKIKIRDFLKKSDGKWDNHPFPVLYRWRLSNCDQKIVYGIRVSKDGSGNIEDFYAYITTRP